MNVYEFQVRGSAADPYEVRFEHGNGFLRCYCTCAAGAKSQVCKHRLNLLIGDGSSVVSDNADQVSELANFLVGTDLEAAFAHLRKAELAVEIAKKELSSANKQLARIMNG